MLLHPQNANNAPPCPSKPLQELQQGSSMLYQAIIKNLKKQGCRVHDLNVQYFYKQTLLCAECFENQLGKVGRVLRAEQVQKYRYFYHLKTIVNYPLILLAQPSSLFHYPIHIIDLFLKSYHPLFTKNSQFSAQKELLNAFIFRIKNRVNALCDQLLASFAKAEENLSNIRLRRDEMKDINKMYQQHFVQILQQKYKQGSIQELQEVLRDFTSNNVNPFDKIYNNLDEVMSYLAQSPLINIQHINRLYSTITDQCLWKVSSIVTTKNQQSKSKDNNELIIMNNSHIILQSQYALQVNQNGLTLSLNNSEIGKLDIAFDSLYHYSKYRLIGVNYDSIQIISYLDTLKVESAYSIQGCTDLLSFDHCIIAISNQNLVKVDLIQHTHSILGEGCSDLQYISKEHCIFVCTNSKGKRIQWNLLSPSFTPPQ